MVDVIEAVIVDSDTLFTLRELCRSSGVHADLIIEMVEIGLLEPEGRAPSNWRFPPRSLPRIHSTLHLRRDLEVNLSGAALALDLMDEVASLRQRVRTLERRLRDSA